MSEPPFAELNVTYRDRLNNTILFLAMSPKKEETPKILFCTFSSFKKPNFNIPEAHTKISIQYTKPTLLDIFLFGFLLAEISVISREVC